MAAAACRGWPIWTLRREDARLLLRTAVVRYMQGRFAAAIKSGQLAKAEAQRWGARDVLAGAFQLLDAADVALGNFDGEPWAQQSLAIWKELGELARQGKLLNQLGVRAYFEGRWDDALGYYSSSRATFARAGDEWNAALTASNIGEILSDQGRYPEAEKARPAERVLRASGAQAETAFATSARQDGRAHWPLPGGAQPAGCGPRRLPERR